MNQRDLTNSKCYNYGCGEGEGPANEKMKEAVRVILKEMGEDPDREGLQRTPERVARAYGEWFGGYDQDPKEILNRTFPSEGYDDLIIVKNISFDSHCEHHMTPFTGFCHIGLIAGDRITGLDKFVKLVDVFARRLQTQEVMTKQIGESIKDVLNPVGIMVLIEAKHNCVGSRETKNKTTSFITTYRYGNFKITEHLENRFINYIGLKEF